MTRPELGCKVAGLGILGENGNEPVTLTNPERSRPHWPLGASFRRNCLEHLAKNSFITLKREGQTWTFGLGERVKAAN